MDLASSFPGQAARTTLTGTRHVVASYSTYEEAQRAVDHLSDSGFPVEQSAIVGRDLRLVEQITGRLTKARATLMGAGSGAWFGLFVGSLLGLFLPGPEWAALILTAVVTGAVFGAAFAFVAQAATSGRRDFASASIVGADGYDLTVTEAYSQRAVQLLTSLG